MYIKARTTFKTFQKQKIIIFIYGFQKKCDLVRQLVSYLLTDKLIHRGAPLLKNIYDLLFFENVKPNSIDKLHI